MYSRWRHVHCKHQQVEQINVLYNTPEGVFISATVQAAGLGVVLVGAHVVLDDVKGGPLLYVHALVATTCNDVVRHQVEVAGVRSVRQDSSVSPLF